MIILGILYGKKKKGYELFFKLTTTNSLDTKISILQSELSNSIYCQRWKYNSSSNAQEETIGPPGLG